MKIKATITFEDGRIYNSISEANFCGLLDIGDGMAFSFSAGVLYKKKGNIICGDICDKVKKVELVYEY